MAKKQQAEETAVMEQPAMVLVRALVPMWGDKEVVPVGTLYHLPVEAAEKLVGMGFVAVATENEEAD